MKTTETLFHHSEGGICRRVLRRGLACGGLILLLSSCVTMGTFTTAKLMKPGSVQFGVEPGFWGAAGNNGLGGFTSVNVATRYGLSKHVELGARAGTGGLELLTKFSLMDDPGLRLSLAPSGGGFALLGAGGGVASLGFQLPLLIGIPFGEHEFTLSPKIHDWYIGAGELGDSASVNLVSVGTGIGATFKLGESFRLNPEVTFLRPLLGSAAAGNSSSGVRSLSGDGVFVQFGLGFQWGGG